MCCRSQDAVEQVVSIAFVRRLCRVIGGSPWQSGAQDIA
jgi:hypothetical protein